MKNASIVSIYKRKEDKSDCSNYREIALLSVAGKILARILLNRLTSSIIDNVLPESQCGFRAGRGTVDMIFTLCQIQEKCREHNRNLFIIFIDLTKAFDTVNREALWPLLRKCGCPDKFVNIVRQFHDGMVGSVQVDGELSDPFPISNGSEARLCSRSDSLRHILRYDVQVIEGINVNMPDSDGGIFIRFRKDGRLFNVKDLDAKTKALKLLITELLYADDCALLAHSEECLQGSLMRLQLRVSVSDSPSASRRPK